MSPKQQFLFSSSLTFSFLLIDYFFSFWFLFFFSFKIDDDQGRRREDFFADNAVTYEFQDIAVSQTGGFLDDSPEILRSSYYLHHHYPPQLTLSFSTTVFVYNPNIVISSSLIWFCLPDSENEGDCPSCPSGTGMGVKIRVEV